jgi:hypothetical protein
MLNLDPAPKVITFDCYGTLVQWHEAMRKAIWAVIRRQPVEALEHRASPSPSPSPSPTGCGRLQGSVKSSDPF